MCLTDVTREILNMYIFVLPLETYGNSEQNYFLLRFGVSISFKIISGLSF